MFAIAMPVDTMPADAAVSMETTVRLGDAGYSQRTANQKPGTMVTEHPIRNQVQQTLDIQLETRFNRQWTSNEKSNKIYNRHWPSDQRPDTIDTAWTSNQKPGTTDIGHPIKIYYNRHWAHN